MARLINYFYCVLLDSLNFTYIGIKSSVIDTKKIVYLCRYFLNLLLIWLIALKNMHWKVCHLSRVSITKSWYWVKQLASDTLKNCCYLNLDLIYHFAEMCDLLWEVTMHLLCVWNVAIRTKARKRLHIRIYQGDFVP